jgi:hypothetical protein
MVKDFVVMAPSCLKSRRHGSGNSGGAVGEFAQDVSVPRVSRRLLDHVDIDPPQRHLP